MHNKKGILIICLLLVFMVAFACQQEQPIAPESTTPEDVFISKTNGIGSPPQFDPPTPCGTGSDGVPNVLITFVVQASDPDPGDMVTLISGFTFGMHSEITPGLPAGATMTPTLPVTGNPVQSTFSWTPTVNQQGWWGIHYLAKDNNGNRTTCTVGIDIGPPPTGVGEGCTPGAWKNHLLNIGEWGPTGYSPGQTVGSVFSAASAFPSLASSTLLQALSLPGGPTVLGMAQNLMRAAVAGVLNAAHPDIAYAVTPAQLINAVNERLASGNRQAMEDLKDKIDIANNAGCPI